MMGNLAPDINRASACRLRNEKAAEEEALNKLGTLYWSEDAKSK